jgi:shikimate kinase
LSAGISLRTSHSRQPSVFLTGARAAGKSSLGALLAQKMQLPFVDTDQRLQAIMGKSISQLVEEKGWAAFRKQESCILEECVRQHARGCIIATGGGMILAAKNRALMRQKGIVLYLNAPAALLASRLQKDPRVSQRPPLSSTPAHSSMAHVLKERHPLYVATAHYQLNASLPLAELCAQALSLLQPLLSRTQNNAEAAAVTESYSCQHTEE